MTMESRESTMATGLSKSLDSKKPKAPRSPNSKERNRAMKYRELTPTEIEAYNVGYQVGNRKIVITDIEWESENEQRIYRKGYMAGLMDYRRNVSNVINVSNVKSYNNVSNVEIGTSITPTTPINKDNINNNININNNNIQDKIVNEYTMFKAGCQGWIFPTPIRKIAAKFWSAETIREIEKQFSCQEYTVDTTIYELLAQYPQNKTKRFVKPTLDEVKAYCRERMNMVDAEKFMNYYESNGWKVGKNPMKDWKATVRTWEKSSFNKPQPQKKNWSNYVGEGSFLRDAKDDPFLEDIFNKKD